ncbi:MAG TPA: hypothetical protein VEJ20_06240, partial [Candidatus Eremiobacteraceae bacterium]|nr:hypothetical protein [Candidatus Eremiobacteraceae bacterium]
DAGAMVVGVDAAFLGQAYADDLNTQPLDSALLIGINASTRLADGAQLTLRVDNATDRTYLSSEDRLGPPSTATLSLAVPLGAATSIVTRCAPAARD